jgi:oxysterol-binding protein-related protein 9/10/11
MASVAEHKSALKQFLASISTIKGDLSSITAPPFLLAPKSAVEFPATWCERPALLVAPASEPNAEKRALLVLKWYLSALKAQQYQNGDKADGVKKPLNAFLGELFIAEWDDAESGKTKLISEQVR